MAESNPNQTSPLTPAADGCPRSDAEPVSDKEERRRKRMKCALYVGIFVVFQVIVILVFVLVVMRIHRPKFGLGPLRIQSLTTGTAQRTASFDLSFIAPIRIKNMNFGPYKYDATDVTFSYGGVALGRVTVPKGKAKFRSTEKVDLAVSLESSGLASTGLNASLGTELGSGTLTLSSSGKMTGKVEVMKILLQQKKSTDMNCTMTIAVSTTTVRSVSCK